MFKSEQRFLRSSTQCRGICYQTGVRGAPPNPYGTGYKRCRMCAVYYITNERFCPCCHLQLRMRPRTRAVFSKWMDKL